MTKDIELIRILFAIEEQLLFANRNCKRSCFCCGGQNGAGRND